MFYIFIKYFFVFLVVVVVVFFLLFFHLPITYLFIHLFIYLQGIVMLILPLWVFLRSHMRESSKQGIQAAWSTPIHYVKWWISHFRGVYSTLTACEVELFLILVKGLWPLYNVIRSSVLIAVRVLFLSPCFIIIIIIVIFIITFIFNIIFIIFIITKIFIKNSLLFF